MDQTRERLEQEKNARKSQGPKDHGTKDSGARSSETGARGAPSPDPDLGSRVLTDTGDPGLGLRISPVSIPPRASWGVMVHGAHGAHGNAPCCWAAVECWCCVLLHAAKTARTQRRRASRVSNARHGSGVQRSKGKRCGRSRASSGRSRTKERENPARKEDGGCKATEGDGGREAGRLQAGCVRARVCSRRRSLCEAYRVLRCAGAPVALLLLSSLR